MRPHTEPQRRERSAGIRWCTYEMGYLVRTACLDGFVYLGVVFIRLRADRSRSPPVGEDDENQGRNEYTQGLRARLTSTQSAGRQEQDTAHNEADRGGFGDRNRCRENSQVL